MEEKCCKINEQTNHHWLLLMTAAAAGLAFATWMRSKHQRAKAGDSPNTLLSACYSAANQLDERLSGDGQISMTG